MEGKRSLEENAHKTFDIRKKHQKDKKKKKNKKNYYQ